MNQTHRRASLPSVTSMSRHYSSTKILRELQAVLTSPFVNWTKLFVQTTVGKCSASGKKENDPVLCVPRGSACGTGVLG
jgi:hypothetical protein